MIEFRILGPLEVVGDDGPIRLAGPRQRATLAILLLNANRVVPVDRLADELYAGRPPVTAVTQVQRQISELRKALGANAEIETRTPGYVLRVGRGQVDLARFEHGVETAATALARGDARAAAGLLRDGLAAWRGAPLADLADEPFARAAAARLEEIRLAAVELRLDADLALGRHALLVPELEALAAQHPLRETLTARLMLALYRSGRQADALAVYRRARQVLVEDLGIEPGPALRRLEQAILAQDASLDASLPAAEPARAVLVVPFADEGLDALLAIARPLARLPGRELIVARLLADEDDVPRVAAALNERRRALDVPARTAAFTTSAPAEEIARLTTGYDAELVLVDAPAGIDGERLPASLAATLEAAVADVAVLAGVPAALGADSTVLVPFGGGEHDWAAVELAALLASVSGARLCLAGTAADARSGRRDSSRLLADVGLAVQSVVGVDAEPLLVEPSVAALVEAARSADLAVTGISPRWRDEGIGAARCALVRAAAPPVLLVRRGTRPGPLAPRESRTRFTWSIDPPAR